MKHYMIGLLMMIVGLTMVGYGVAHSVTQFEEHIEHGSDPEPIPNPPAKVKQGIIAVTRRPLPGARETVWSAYIAQQMGGIAEYKVVGGRVDVLTKTTAWEVEWAGKHDEAIGQAIRYSMCTGRRGGVILLMGRGDAEKEAISYWICVAAAQRCNLAIRAYSVREGR